MSDNKKTNLPTGWAVTTIGDIVEGKVAQSGPTASDSFTYVDISSIDNQTKRITDTKTILIADAPSRARQVLATGDVLVSMTRPNLNAVALVPSVLNFAIGSTGFDVLRVNGAEPSWLYYTVQSNKFIHAMCELVQGALYPAVRSHDIRSYSLPLPPLNEQRRIVAKIEELFSELDAGVAALERVRANLKRYRASVLQAAVTGKLTAAWRAKHRDGEPASELLRRILAERRRKWEQDQLAKFAAASKTPPKGWQSKYVEPPTPDTTGLPELPAGWCWASVEQVAEFTRYGSSSKTNEESSGVPVLRMGNIVDGSLDLGVLKYLPQNHSEFPELLLQKGDLLFNRTNSAELVGKSAVYEGQFASCSYASYLIGVRCLSGCDSRYLCHYINSSYGRQWVKSVVSQQVGQANVNGSKLQALAFPLPPSIEQEQILLDVAEKFSQIEAVTTAIERDLLRAARLRQSILKRAFAGQLVPQDPSDEPADKLRERIRQQREASTNGNARRTRTKAKPSPE
ncbi:MAG: restriction endonuclease subunit S [Bacteroidales bacterium]|nr:restriction endonuclease subunit S [Bacteroidales bacterium]